MFVFLLILSFLLVNVSVSPVHSLLYYVCFSSSLIHSLFYIAFLVLFFVLCIFYFNFLLCSASLFFVFYFSSASHDFSVLHSLFCATAYGLFFVIFIMFVSSCCNSSIYN